MTPEFPFRKITKNFYWIDDIVTDFGGTITTLGLIIIFLQYRIYIHFSHYATYQILERQAQKKRADESDDDLTEFRHEED